MAESMNSLCDNNTRNYDSKTTEYVESVSDLKTIVGVKNEVIDLVHIPLQMKSVQDCDAAVDSHPDSNVSSAQRRANAGPAGPTLTLRWPNDGSTVLLSGHPSQSSEDDKKDITGSIDLTHDEPSESIETMQLSPEAEAMYQREGFIQCHICSTLHNSRSSHFRHMRNIHLIDERFACEVCWKRFPRKNLLIYHMTESHGADIPMPFRCEICAKTFKFKYSLNSHMVCHSEARPFTCKTCEKSFARMSTLRVHMTTHTGDKPVCVQCGKRFWRNSYLLKHVREEHMGIDAPFPCQECPSKFWTASELERHVRLHQNIRPYQCTVCNKRFTQGRDLSRHMNVHTRKKVYTCKVCERTFVHCNNLTSHLRTHSGERPYECLICGKTFSQKGILACHVRIHTQDKPHECDVCHKTFAQKGNLLVHQRTHTGEKPFVCPRCGRAFSQKCALQKHTATVHKNESDEGSE